jgi:hypothetical protein
MITRKLIANIWRTPTGEILQSKHRHDMQVDSAGNYMSRVGQGFPDLLVCAHKKWILLEVKDGAKSPSERRLTEAQERFHKACKGPLAVVLSRDDAIQACEAMRG